MPGRTSSAVSICPLGMPVGAGIVSMPCAVNSARARGMSKLCAYENDLGYIFAAPRISAEIAPRFHACCAIATPASVPGTPNSRSSAERIRVASGSPPERGTAGHEHRQASEARDLGAIAHALEGQMPKRIGTGILCGVPTDPATQDDDCLRISGALQV